MNSASLIAYAFVKKAIDEGNPITQMKLQKLVYFAQGYFLAKYNQRLYSEEIQAWKFGPVIPSIYNDYKFYGAAPIIDTQFILTDVNIKDVEKLDTQSRDAIEYTWNATKHISAAQLSTWTHNPDSPWSKCYKEGQNGIPIDVNEIKEYFRSFLYGENN